MQMLGGQAPFFEKEDIELSGSETAKVMEIAQGLSKMVEDFFARVGDLFEVVRESFPGMLSSSILSRIARIVVVLYSL